MKLQNKKLLQTQAYINGQWVSADDGATLAVMNPSTGEELVNVASCGAVETRRALRLPTRPCLPGVIKPPRKERICCVAGLS